MDALMSHFLLRAAGVKRQATDLPQDPMRSKFPRHTCDTLIEQEDLRHEPHASTELNHLATERLAFTYRSGYSWYQPGAITPAASVRSQGSCDSVSESLSDNCSSSSVCSDDSIFLNREVESPVPGPVPHPFSIAALIGDSASSSSQKSSTPAVVFSALSQQEFSPLAGYQRVMDSSVLNQRVLPSACESAVSSLGSVVDSCVSFWCHTCHALCMDYQDARAHQYRHTVQGAKCNLKKSMFYQHGYITQHEKLDDEKMKCGLCDKIVAQCFFTKHQRLHDGHYCDVCNHEFSTNSRLQDHMNIHKGNTPFTCTICDRKFAKRSSLTQHQRYHRDHQSFKCNYCEKSFSSKYACAVHERLHTGDFPFKCHVSGCMRAFPQKIQLKLHLNSHF